MALSATQKGRIVEQLVGANLLLASEGTLRVSLPLVDDEGVDLIVGDKESDTPILLQIKSRFSLTKRHHYRAQVRKATFRASDRRFILFVYYDREKRELGDAMWLVPSRLLARKLSGQKETRETYIFDSHFNSKGDMWAELRFSKKELAARIKELSLQEYNDDRTEREGMS